jgi:thioredoxin-like negative regulator of GroEL
LEYAGRLKEKDMYLRQFTQCRAEELPTQPWDPKKHIEYAESEHHETMAVALHLLERGYVKKADELLTAATLEDPSDPELWLATGICRLRRGSVRSAAAAFEMSVWLSDDDDARDLYDLCTHIHF